MESSKYQTTFEELESLLMAATNTAQHQCSLSNTQKFCKDCNLSKEFFAKAERLGLGLVNEYNMCTNPDCTLGHVSNHPSDVDLREHLGTWIMLKTLTL